MSTYYNFYTEGLVNGTWILLDPTGPHINYDGSIDTRLYDTYWNGSRSFFGETYDELIGISDRIRLSETSEGFRKAHVDPERFGDRWESEAEREAYVKEYTEYMDENLLAFPPERLESIMPKPGQHQFHGLYHKDRIAAFERGDMEDLWEEDISAEAYSKLDETARQLYQYYEWDDPGSKWCNLPILKERIQNRIRDFERANFTEPDAVRVLMYTT